MRIVEEALNGVLLIEPQVFGDKRGYFFESFRESFLKSQGVEVNFVQDNESLSSRGVLRGLHYQAPPHAQGKLVRVTSGAVVDVAVDIRRNSATFGKHYSCVLSEENKYMLWIPPGFAHGFATLKDETRFLYKCTDYYSKESEGGILWNDPALNIDWQLEEPLVSEKDLELPTLGNLNSPF